MPFSSPSALASDDRSVSVAAPFRVIIADRSYAAETNWFRLWSPRFGLLAMRFRSRLMSSDRASRMSIPQMARLWFTSSSCRPTWAASST